MTAGAQDERAMRTERGRPVRPVRATVVEGGIVAAVCVALSLIVNSISPRGLTLTRDYFPAVSAPAAIERSENRGSVRSAAATAEKTPAGARLVDLNQALRWHADPRRELGLIAFVDARNERDYRAGHIPGAVSFDRFYPERHLAEVLAACALAEVVAIYCNGGDCNDSHFAAGLLRDAGVPADRLAIFGGGMAAWQEHGAPIERGERNSGDVRRP